jgi:sugar phosphate isomerase/epimerase
VSDRLALSTMYAQRWLNQDDLNPFFALGSDLGFQHFELNHVLSPAAVATVHPARVRIAAVHHPCPLTPAYKPSMRLTSSDPAARAEAARQIEITIETAARMGAPAVVLHLGYVEDSPERVIQRLVFELESRYNAGQKEQNRYASVRNELLAVLDALEPQHIARARAALLPLLTFARRHGISLGLETGYYPHELPRPGGMAQLLADLADRGLGAWLDTGHVGSQSNLGLTAFADWFDVVGSHWLGAHLHDVVGLRDHLAAGLGDLDFRAIGAHLPHGAIRTCEFDWYFTPDEVRQGMRFLERAGCA